MSVRRTPKLTKQAQALFTAIVTEDDGWTPGQTTRDIAMETGLSPSQVRDAIFGPAADAWRRQLMAQRRGTIDASSERPMGPEVGAQAEVPA